MADELLFNGKYKCSIWKAFARRGLGANASTGATSNDLIVTQDFTMPTGVDIVATVNPIAAIEGSTVTYTVQSKCKCSPISNATITAVLPTNMTYINGSASNGGTFSGNTLTWNAQNFAAAAIQNYTFQAKVNTGTYVATSKPLDDNFDGSTPAGAWVSTALKGTAQWVTSTAQFVSSTSSVFAVNTPTAPSDLVYKSGLSFNLTGPATLSFAHRFFTEPDFDGGVVEISINNGATWQDLGPFMTTNGYNGSLGTFSRKGFTGDGKVWRTTTVSLESFCGTTAQIRFRMLNDDNTDCGVTGQCGWFIDDVSLSVPSGANTTGNAVTTAGNSSESACLQILKNTAVSVVYTEGVLQLFPNPANETVTIRTDKPLTHKLRFSLLSPIGQVITTGEINAETLTNGFSLDCRNVAAGLYFLEYKSETLKGVEKLVISH